MTDQSVRYEKHIDISNGEATAVDWLEKNTGLSKQRIKQAMNKGAVWLTRGKSTNRLRRATQKLLTGDTLHLYYDASLLSLTPPEAQLIADEGAYSVWYKPCGMLSQGSKWGDHCTIYRWAEKFLKPERPAYIVHRLDRAATGLIVLAHEKKVAARLAELFQERRVGKHYRVIVHGRFPKQPTTLDTDIDGKQAVSHVQRLDYDPDKNRSLLDVRIDTGRKHQIRRHLSRAGFPVVGDRLYSNTCKDNDCTEDLQLRCISLDFECPVTHTPRHYSLAEEFLPSL